MILSYMSFFRWKVSRGVIFLASWFHCLLCTPFKLLELSWEHIIRDSGPTQLHILAMHKCHILLQGNLHHIFNIFSSVLSIAACMCSLPCMFFLSFEKHVCFHSFTRCTPTEMVSCAIIWIRDSWFHAVKLMPTFARGEINGCCLYSCKIGFHVVFYFRYMFISLSTNCLKFGKLLFADCYPNVDHK
jgi:hypothetical protein